MLCAGAFNVDGNYRAPLTRLWLALLYFNVAFNYDVIYYGRGTGRERASCHIDGSSERTIEQNAFLIAARAPPLLLHPTFCCPRRDERKRLRTIICPSLHDVFSCVLRNLQLVLAEQNRRKIVKRGEKGCREING